MGQSSLLTRAVLIAVVALGLIGAPAARARLPL